MSAKTINYPFTGSTLAAPPKSKSKKDTQTPAGREHIEISQTLPVILLAAAALVVLLPTSVTMLVASFVAAMIVCRILFLQIFRTGHLRVVWFMATGLLLGYGLGTFNTAAQMFVAGDNLSQSTRYDQVVLCNGLALALAVCASMYLIGPLVEPPIDLKVREFHSRDQILLFVMMGTVALAYATGSVGFMGVSKEGHGGSVIGAFAVTFLAVMPAFTVLLAQRQNRPYLWILVGLEIMALLPQGRQALIYPVVLVFLALTVSGIQLQLKSSKTILLIVVAVTLFYCFNKVYYAMRYARNQSGHKANINLIENIRDGFEIALSGDTQYSNSLQKNLRDRTLVLGYLSTLLDASWSHEPLWGKAALFDLRFGIPSALDRDKDSIISIGAEEVLVNPEFGLRVRDEPNNILTTGIADFGILGCFIYPILVSSCLSFVFRISQRRMPAPISVILFLQLTYIMLHTEIASSSYFVAARNMALIAVVLLFVDKIAKSIWKPSGRRRTSFPSSSAVRAAALLVFAPLCVSLFPANAKAQGKELSLTSFDANCGHGSGNCRPAFQRAFKALADAHGGILNLPAGIFELEFPEVPSDSKSAPPLSLNSLIVVPPNTQIVGHRGSDGKPDSIIEFSETSVPIFIFPNSSGSSMRDLHFRFIGKTAKNFPYGDVALLRVLGFNPTFPHGNQMAGGSYEMFSVLYMFNSEHCTFDDLLFDSKTHDNNHVLGFAIDAKGKGVMAAGGAGGLTSLAEGNTFSNIQIYDYIMGMMFSGQQDLHVDKLTADRRGSTMDVAPGHLIYVAAKIRYTPTGGNQYKTDLDYNKGIDISNVYEGPDTYSNVHSGATLSPKYIDGGTVENVDSHFPVGLIQTMSFVENMTFKNLKWESDYHLCENAPEVCQAAVINCYIGKDPNEINNLTFENISLKSTNEPITTNFMGHHIVVKGLTIETPPTFKKGQTNSNGVLSVKQADDVTVSGYTYKPRITDFDPAKHYNSPFACWVPCKNVKGDAQTKWPDGVALPPPDHQVVKSVFQGQDQDPSKNVNVTSKVVKGQSN